MAIVGFAVVGLLAAAGALTRRARRVPSALWLVPLVMWGVVFVLAANRFRAPLEPFLLLLAALAVVSGCERARRWSGDESGTISIADKGDA